MEIEVDGSTGEGNSIYSREGSKEVMETESKILNTIIA